MCCLTEVENWFVCAINGYNIAYIDSVVEHELT